MSMVKHIQNTIVRSFAARALAVKEICSNRGSKTPGIDDYLLDTTEKRMKAIYALRELSTYEAQPVRRV